MSWVGVVVLVELVNCVGGLSKAWGKKGTFDTAIY
jgi:hypothetical protein